MPIEGHISGNDGEWSEQYVMYYLLTNKVLKGSNKKLEHNGTEMPLIKVIRKENGTVVDYIPNDDDKTVKI